MRLKARAVGLSLLWVVVSGLAYVGVFQPLDEAISELRFSAATRPASGSVVVLDIDSASLSAIGVWPWPRSVYAKALDNLGTLGSAEVAFDVDFSSRSSEADDTAFEASLQATGGYAYLAAFQQLAGVGQQSKVNLPLPRFRKYASPVGVNVITDASGVVHSFPAAMVTDGALYPSLAATLSAVRPERAEVLIDYSIDPTSIDRISFIDVYNSTVERSRIANKQVVIGASALELRDIFSVPRYGTLPGPVLQALGTETLKQSRALVRWTLGVPLAMAAAIAVLLMLQGALQLSLIGVIATSLSLGVAAEVLALILQATLGIIVPTVPLHAAELAYVMVLMGQEVAARRRLHVRASRERDVSRMILDRVIADNFDGVVVVDETRTVVAASRLAEGLLGAGSSITGRNAESVLPAPFFQAVATMLVEDREPSRLEQIELELKGRRLVFEYTVTLSKLAPAGEEDLPDGTRHVACLTFHDVTERRQHERRLTFLANHDALTGALSRSRFVQVIEDTLADPERADMTVLVLDLTRFRLVNETLGHAHGDSALREAYRRLQHPDALAVARMGGDHFAMALPSALSEQGIAELCQDVLSGVTCPYRLGEHRAVLGAKIGVTTTALSGKDPERLLSHADMALSAAKAGSGNAHAVFSPSMDAAVSEKQAMEVALRNALALSQLMVAFQPQVNMSTNQIVGFEALVRWRHPELGTISPGKFIPLAEETGLIVELGRWVLETACRECAAWPAWVKIAVNISPVQFELGDVAADVAAALAASGLSPARLEIEITEGVFIAPDSRIGRTLEQLRGMGVGVALDDFGTGYSSLSYLGRLPIDKIKIDQSFVRELTLDPEAEAIVTAVMTLSRSLGKTVIAEGVETEGQKLKLRALGCEIGQGYLFGRAEDVQTTSARFFGADSGLARTA